MPPVTETRQKYAPKHRQTRGDRFARSAPAAVVRNTVMLSSVAVAATGVPVIGGVLDGSAEPVSSDAPASTSSSTSSSSTSSEPIAAAISQAELEDRADVVSRSDSRDRADSGKQASLSQAEGPAVTRTEDLSEADPREIGRALLPEYGFSSDQFSCLDALYVSESNWRIDADNPTSSAYGIPQALTELHDLPADYMTSAESQIRWGLEYIQDSYGTPCGAWEFKQANNWY